MPAAALPLIAALLPREPTVMVPEPVVAATLLARAGIAGLGVEDNTR